MADFFEKLGKDIKDGWDDVKEKVKDGFDDLKTDVDNLGAEAEENSYAIPKTPSQEAEESLAAGIVEGMVQGNTLTSPVDSKVLTAAHTPGHIGISFADSMGVVVALPDAMQNEVKLLVKPEEDVKKGQPIMELSDEAMKNCTIDLIAPVLETGTEGEPERIIRVFGPITPEETK